MGKDLQIVEDVKVDQSSLVQQAIRSGKGVIIINDNRHNIIGDISGSPWNELLEMVIEKAPSPKLRNIEAEIIRIADRKCNTHRESSEYLGLKRSTFEARLEKVNDNKALTLLRD